MRLMLEVVILRMPSNVARGSTMGKAIINGAAEADVSTVAVNDCFRLTTTCILLLLSRLAIYSYMDGRSQSCG
jgi:hypothetical protein